MSSLRPQWRSLEELADDAYFVARAAREFPSLAEALAEPQDHRRALKLMAAALAMAGLGGCASRGKQILYGPMDLGFRGSDRQRRHYHTTYGVMVSIMAPLVISVHSIIGLDFAGAATVGWHSTQFPPFFVFGALLSGFAMVLLLVTPLRRLLGLEDYITGRPFDVLCRLLLASSLCLAYAYVMDAFTIFYGGDDAERQLFIDKISGAYAAVYWAAIMLNVVHRFYLNLPFFVGRIVVYSIVWLGLGWFILVALRRDGREVTGDGACNLASARIAPAGLILLAITVTFAAIDTTMSLDPMFASSADGLLAIAEMGLPALSTSIFAAAIGESPDQGNPAHPRPIADGPCHFVGLSRYHATADPLAIRFAK